MKRPARATERECKGAASFATSSQHVGFRPEGALKHGTAMPVQSTDVFASLVTINSAPRGVRG